MTNKRILMCKEVSLMKKILICYYSRTHSTKEVCENIKETLDESFDVTLRPISSVQEVKDYETVIIAAPVHGMNWHQTAFDFVTSHQESLRRKEVIYIALASLAYQGRTFWQKKVFNSLEKPSKIVNPMETAIFGGLTSDTPKIIGGILGIPKNAKKDQRDWKMIEAWKKNLIKHL